MAKKFKNKKDWKTKEINGNIHMICMNSDLKESKYPDWAPNDGEGKCDQWSAVGTDTSMVLCSQCTSRSQRM